MTERQTVRESERKRVRKTDRQSLALPDGHAERGAGLCEDGADPHVDGCASRSLALWNLVM